MAGRTSNRPALAAAAAWAGTGICCSAGFDALLRRSIRGDSPGGHDARGAGHYRRLRLLRFAGAGQGRELSIASPWGEPSDRLRRARSAASPSSFSPATGAATGCRRRHQYRANIDSLKRAGVTDLVSLSGLRSFRQDLPPERSSSSISSSTAHFARSELLRAGLRRARVDGASGRAEARRAHRGRGGGRSIRA